MTEKQERTLRDLIKWFEQQDQHEFSVDNYYNLQEIVDRAREALLVP